MMRIQFCGSRWQVQRRPRLDVLIDGDAAVRPYGLQRGTTMSEPEANPSSGISWGNA
jgi:hypothetical protein